MLSDVTGFEYGHKPRNAASRSWKREGNQFFSRASRRNAAQWTHLDVSPVRLISDF